MARRRRRRPRSNDRLRWTHRLVIDGPADTFAFAQKLADRYAHGHAAAVTDDQGKVGEVWMFYGARHTAEDAIHAGLGGSDHPEARRAVLVSVLDGVDLATPNELEVEMWHTTVDRFSEVGLELTEWVIVSGELLRSLAITAETESSWRSG